VLIAEAERARAEEARLAAQVAALESENAELREFKLGVMLEVLAEDALAQDDRGETVSLEEVARRWGVGGKQG
jgi:hypothetical protein